MDPASKEISVPSPGNMTSRCRNRFHAAHRRTLQKDIYGFFEITSLNTYWPSVPTAGRDGVNYFLWRRASSTAALHIAAGETPPAQLSFSFTRAVSIQANLLRWWLTLLWRNIDGRTVYRRYLIIGTRTGKVSKEPRYQICSDPDRWSAEFSRNMSFQ